MGGGRSHNGTTVQTTRRALTTTTTTLTLTHEATTHLLPHRNHSGQRIVLCSRVAICTYAVRDVIECWRGCARHAYNHNHKFKMLCCSIDPKAVA